ncbi:helix-turn-helix domain-containing protein [Actinomadura rubrisoli]|nr:helix-turn-helix transcriptional regulator [Actinomadura rubrisoli]
MAPRNHTTATRSFGTAIRTIRESKQPKISQRQLAELMHVSESLVAAWESGRQHPKPAYLPQLISILEIDTGMLLRILGDLMEGETSPEWTDRWSTIEDAADILLSYEHSFIPGILQVENYARPVVQFTQPLGDVSQKLNSRMSRKEILQKEDAAICSFIIQERALYNLVGSPAVMREQMHALIEEAHRPNVTIQVLPDDAGCHPGQAGAFMIAKLEGNEYVYQDGTWRGHVMEDEHDITEFARIWLTIQAETFNKKASIELIEKVEEQWSR